MMHAPLWHARLVHRVVPAYLLALVPALIALVGLSLVIEMAYRILVKADSGTAMTFFSLPVDAGKPLSWIIAGLLAAGGLWAFRRTWPVVGDAWSGAIAAAGLRGDA
jgi:branched-chain amino acid transport system permease protein